MLTPQTLQKLPDDLIDLVSEVQTDIIKSIAKKLVKADYLTPSAEWQLYKASQLKMSTKEITAMLAEFTGKSKRQISSCTPMPVRSNQQRRQDIQNLRQGLLRHSEVGGIIQHA